MACRGASGSKRGAGIRSTMAANRGSRSVPSTPCSVAAHPARALEKRMGKSIWCSSASRSRKSSSTSWTTSSMRASGRSTLLITSTTGQPGLQGLAQDEPGLGQGALGGVHQQQDTVHHGQAPLHLPAEVGVSRGVDDVDLDPVVEDGRVLGQDGDALLPLQVTRVHHPFVDRLVVPERPRLPEHGVDQGGLAVVDVGHDGHVADVVSGLQRHKGRRLPAEGRWVGQHHRPLHPGTAERKRLPAA